MLDFYTHLDTTEYLANKDFDQQTLAVDSIDKLVLLANILKSKVGVISAWDTETTGFDYHTDKLVGLGVCWGLSTNQSAYIPIGHTEGFNIDLNVVKRVLKPILESTDYPKVFHNAKFDLQVLMNVGIEVMGLAGDTIVAYHLLNPLTTRFEDFYGTFDPANEPSKAKLKIYKLDRLIKQYKPVYPLTYSQTVGNLNSIAEVSVDLAAKYCGMDCYCTLALVEPIHTELKKNLKLWELYQTVELPLIQILTSMEFKGLTVDLDWYEKESIELNKQIDLCNEEANTFKEGINLNSPIQLQEYLFNDCALDPKQLKLTKIKTGYSLNAEALQRLVGIHPIVDLILKQRSIQKLKGTYVDGIIKRINPTTNRLHPQFNQIVTDTGRLSSENPNAQNFPSQGEKVKYRQGIVAREGYSLIGVDYSQCELRILAYLSGEPTLINAYLTNADVHTIVTAKLLGIRPYEVTKNQRRAGKTLNFGIIYGETPDKLSRQLNCSLTHAERLFATYWKELPYVARWMSQTHRKAVCNGFVETILGRRRYFDFEMPLLRSLKGSDWRLCESIDTFVRSKGYRLWEQDAASLRAAGNMPIQGSNADLTKLAMVKLRPMMADDCYMLLQIHDEIIFECIDQMIDSYLPRITHTMSNAYRLENIPLVVDYKIGKNWSELK